MTKPKKNESYENLIFHSDQDGSISSQSLLVS